MSEATLIAVIAAVPSTIAALTLVQARRNHRQLETSNGRTSGQYIETTHAAVISHGVELSEIRRNLDHHINTSEPILARTAALVADLQHTVDQHLAEDQASFAELRETLDDVVAIPPEEDPPA